MRYLILFAACLPLFSQPTGLTIQPGQTQETLLYTCPDSSNATIQVADLNRGNTIAAASGTGSTVTVTTVLPHGLFTANFQTVYLFGGTPWDGWQGPITVTGASSFTFSSSTSHSTITIGQVGVGIADVNATLYSGSNLDTRSGTEGSGTNGQRTFVVGTRGAPIASDGNRYSRALQVYSAHMFTVTCNSGTVSKQYSTENIPVGNPLNPLPIIDSGNQYNYETVQWSNQYQFFIDPYTGVASHRVSSVVDQQTTGGVFGSQFDQTPTSWVVTGTGPKGSGIATCVAANCGNNFFLRADGLNASGSGNSYAAASLGIDYFQVIVTSMQTVLPCSGSDCIVQACLTVNGVACATPSLNVTLSSTPATKTFGSQNLIDMWQGGNGAFGTGGPPPIASPDASPSTGLASYISGTGIMTWQGGANFFSTKWVAGSKITFNGNVDCVIASVQSERQITVPSCGSTVGTSAAFTGYNFGVLIKKQTTTTNTVIIGPTTYTYGQSGFAGWISDGTQNCSVNSPLVTNAQGIQGYHCMFPETQSTADLWFVSLDGTVATDLGSSITTSLNNDPNVPTNLGGSNTFFTNQPVWDGAAPLMFSPNNANCWYGVIQPKDLSDISMGMVKMCYLGDNSTGTTPGVRIPSCDSATGNNGTYSFNANIAHSCLRFTWMTPNPSDLLTSASPIWGSFATPAVGAYSPTGPSQFNSLFTTYVAGLPNYNGSQGWNLGGISPDGNLLVFSRSANQNSPAWMVVYSLGNESPIGVAGGMQLIAAAPTFLACPFCWAGVHAVSAPWSGGTLSVALDSSWKFNPANAAFSSTLAANVAATNSVNCPSNIYGAPVTGTVCTVVSLTTATPTRSIDGLSLRSILAGDLMLIGCNTDEMCTNQETWQVISISGTSATVWRTAPVSHLSGDQYLMNQSPGTFASGGVIWNFTLDPTGTNLAFPANTMMQRDLNGCGGHCGGNGFMEFGSGAAGNTSICPLPTCWNGGYQNRFGTGFNRANATVQNNAISPLFTGLYGAGAGNNSVDEHPSATCIPNSLAFPAGWCVTWYTTNNYTPSATNQGLIASLQVSSVSGNIWKYTAASGAALQRKTFPTAAYVGNVPFIDASGPTSSISATAFTYCYALFVNECISGSAIGDIYFNAPYLWNLGCPYPGTAVQPDDRTAACIFDAHISAMYQIGVPVPGQDLSATHWRTLGTAAGRWNQLNVFANANTPAPAALFTLERWVDGVRSDLFLFKLPPMTFPDSINRAQFVPITVPVTSGTHTIQFGYAEWGSPSNYYCSSRKEACQVVDCVITQATPFYYPSEGHSGSSCTSVQIPGLSGLTMYYSVDGGAQQVARVP